MAKQKKINQHSITDRKATVKGTTGKRNILRGIGARKTGTVFIYLWFIYINESVGKTTQRRWHSLKSECPRALLNIKQA